jgi:hypothetical protein
MPTNRHTRRLKAFEKPYSLKKIKAVGFLKQLFV